MHAVPLQEMTVIDLPGIFTDPGKDQAETLPEDVHSMIHAHTRGTSAPLSEMTMMAKKANDVKIIQYFHPSIPASSYVGVESQCLSLWLSTVPPVSI